MHTYKPFGGLLYKWFKCNVLLCTHTRVDGPSFYAVSILIEMPDFDNIDFRDIDSPKFKKQFDKIVKELEQLNPEDLPIAIARIWEKAGPVLARRFLEKNFKLWGMIWENGIAHSYMNGITKAFPFSFAEPGLIRAAADDYFQTHGMELVKSLTETDMKKLKGQMVENWGIGEHAFAKKFRDSYPVSEDRLKLIYRTEHGLTENTALLDVSKKLGREYKVWVVIGDERTCDICGAHQEDTVPIDEMFVITNEKGEVRYIDTPRRSHPGCYSDDTEVFTENGWKLFKDVSSDELIWTLGDNGEPVLDEQEGQVIYYRNEDMIRFSSRTLDCLVTPDHEMMCIPGKMYNTGDRTIYRKDADKTGHTDMIPRSATWSGEDTDIINVCGRDFDTVDFVSFIGWYVSEGSISKPPSGKWQIKIAQEKEDNRQEIIDLCTRMFGKVWVGKGAVYIPYIDDMVDYFLEIGHSFDKHIPHHIKQLSPRYLRILLNSLLKGDGHVRKSSWKGHPEWNFNNEEVLFTSSKHLVSDVTEIALKLSLRPSFSTRSSCEAQHWNGTYTSKPCYDVRFNRYLYSRPRSIEIVPYDGMVYCLTMKHNHSLYVRRNGKANWSGNCRCNMKTVRAGDLTTDQRRRLVENGYPDPQKQNSTVKQNYKCKENPPGSGNFKCEDGSETKGMDVKELTKKVKALHTQRMGGHVKLRGILENSFADRSKFKITGRVKSVESIQEKMKRKSMTDPSKFDDISGLRIVTSNAAATQEAINMLKAKFKNVMVPGTEDNYIENPKETGYHAYHLTVKIDGEPHEVQVRTERFNEWAEKYHALYKGEEWSRKANTADTVGYFKQAASAIQMLDEGYSNVQMPPCPPELAEVRLCL